SDQSEKPEVARQFTLDQLSRKRAFRLERQDGVLRFQPVHQAIFEPDVVARAPIEHHDVLVIAPPGVHGKSEFYRFPVRKPAASDAPAIDDELAGAGVGTYTRPPELLDAYDYSQRRVLSVARPEQWESEKGCSKARGPALATLPVKQEPASTSCVAC